MWTVFYQLTLILIISLNGACPQKILSALLYHLFIFLDTCASTKPRHSDEHKLLGRLKVNISTIFSTEVPRKSTQDKQSLQSAICTVETEERLSGTTALNDKRINWHESIATTDEYSLYRVDSIDILTVFKSMLMGTWAGYQLSCIEWTSARRPQD